MTVCELPTIRGTGGREAWWQAEDGTWIRYADFKGEQPVARIIFLPGFTEFIEKHLETVSDLVERGFDVLILDWRGQGLSDRALADRHRGYVASMDLFLSDLDGVLRETCVIDAGVPVLIMGHSMGGHLALRLASECEFVIRKVIAIAPMQDVNTGAFPAWFARCLAHAGSRFGLADAYLPGGTGYGAKQRVFEGNPLTSDRRRFSRTHAQIDRNPDLALGNPTFGWLSAAFRSMALFESRDYVSRISLPVLIVQPSDETVVKNQAQDALAARLPDGVLVKLFGSKHEVLHEVDGVRAEFWQAFDRFVGS